MKIIFKKEFIENEIKKLGLNITQFTQLCGISKYHYYKLCKNNFKIDCEVIYKIAKFLNVSTKDFIIYK